MSTEILSVNLDSLYLSVHGELNLLADSIIPAAKQACQDEDRDMYPLPEFDGIPGGCFFVHRKGASRDYPYVISNARFHIQLTRRGGSRPTLVIQCKSDLLYEYPLSAVETATERLCGALMDTTTKLTVSRADIACDFQDPTFEYPHMSDVNTRARSRFVHYEGKHVTGMTFGKHQGSMQVQIYSKSETLKSDHKEWMKDVWAAGGDYDEEKPVFRVELRFYRQVLRELKDENGSIMSISDLDKSLRDLADYSVGGMKPFFRVVDSLYRLSGLNSGHSERCDNASWWETVRHAFRKLDGSTGRKRIADEVRYLYGYYVRQALAFAATAAAISRSQGWHPATNPAHFVKDMATAFFLEDKLLWPEWVNERTLRLQGEIGPEQVTPVAC